MKPYKLLLVLILLIIGCSAANRDWKKAQSLDSIDLYREFVDKYPSSTHLNEAESRIQELDWEKAKKKNTIQDYEEYIRNYPESSYCTIAKEKIENIAWNEVLDNETITMGFAAIKGMGEKAITEIISKQPFSSFLI